MPVGAWPPVRTKADMYRRLAAGEFGNTIPQYLTLEAWEAARGGHRGLWGVRSAVKAGDKRMRLNVPAEEVADYVRTHFPGGGFNVSPMIDPYAVLRAEVFMSDFSPCGLNAFYVPPGMVVPEDPWRGSFRQNGRQCQGVAAWGLLEKYLWPSDLEDLRVLLDRYPGHVVEFSACDRAVGLVAHRNTCVWEVRSY